MSYKVIDRLKRHKEAISTFVQISATSTYNDDCRPTNLFDQSTNIYHSLNENGTYLMLVFHYPIYADKLYTVSARNRDPRYWVFEGSNDGINFVELKKNDGESLCGKWDIFDNINLGCMSYVPKEHELKNKEYYSLFRFMIYDVSSNNSEYFLILNQIDIIGKINTKCYFFSHRIRTINSLISFTISLFIS